MNGRVTMLKEWYEGLSRQNKMLVRVAIVFTAAFSFWWFYYSIVYENKDALKYSFYLIGSVMLAGFFIYLVVGRTKK